MTKEQILDHFKDINHAYNESTRYDDLKRMLDELDDKADLLVLTTKIRAKYIEQCNDLRRILDESGFGRATVCEDNNEPFKVVVDGVTYYAVEPKVKTVHEKTGEVVIGGFYALQILTK